MKTIRVTLPATIAVVELGLPPKGLCSNASSSSSRLAKSRATAAYRTESAWSFVRAARELGMLPEATVRATFYWGDRRRRDVTNAFANLKPVWDGLADSGLVPDDYVLRPLPTVYTFDKGRPRLLIEVFDVRVEFEVQKNHARSTD